VGTFPRASIERCGCAWFPRRQLQAVGHSSLCTGHETGHGPGTAQETDAWMDALSPRFSSSTTIRNESRPRRISQRIAYRREAKEAVGFSPWRSVTRTFIARQRYPVLTARSLRLNSTAIRRTSLTWKDVPLWSHRPTHPGQVLTLRQLTSAPSVSGLARHRSFASRYCAHLPDQHAACTGDRYLSGTDTACSDR